MGSFCVVIFLFLDSIRVALHVIAPFPLELPTLKVNVGKEIRKGTIGPDSVVVNWCYVNKMELIVS